MKAFWRDRVAALKAVLEESPDLRELDGRAEVAIQDRGEPLDLRPQRGSWGLPGLSEPGDLHHGPPPATRYPTPRRRPRRPARSSRSACSPRSVAGLPRHGRRSCRDPARTDRTPRAAALLSSASPMPARRRPPPAPMPVRRPPGPPPAGHRANRTMTEDPGPRSCRGPASCAGWRSSPAHRRPGRRGWLLARLLPGRERRPTAGLRGPAA